MYVPSSDFFSHLYICNYCMKLIFFRDGVVYALQRRGRILLADDMGLGKTIQALAVASAYQKDWPLLIVCPSSVRFSWRSAIFRWLPSVPEEDVIVITSGKIHNNNRLFRRITRDLFKGAIFILRKGKGVGGIAKYLLFLTGVGGWFWIILT